MGIDNNSERAPVNINFIRQKIDPEKTLPNIQLQISKENMPNSGSLVFTKYDLINDGQMVGKMTIDTDKFNHMSWIKQINIEEDCKGKGFGLAAHVVAIEKSLQEGNKFRTHDWSHSEGSKHIWDVLAKKGVAKIIEPFEPDDNGKYIGHYEVTSELLK